jgi:hypothetical protein
MADVNSVFLSPENGNTLCSRPIGDKTTIIDIADRDEMDDKLFPLTSEISWFTRNAGRRVLPFTPVLQEFSYKGTAEFGNRLVFECGSVNAGDILFTVALQVKLGHWLPPQAQEYVQSGRYTYVNPSDAWFYANSLGTSLIESAEFMLEDQTIEIIDGDFTNIVSNLYPDINSQIGIATDAFGIYSNSELTTWNLQQLYPTTNGYITCILPFSFQRVRRQEGFPLLSVKEGTVRFAITLKSFDKVVRQVTPELIGGECGPSPLNKTIDFYDNSVTPTTIVCVITDPNPPRFADVRLLTSGVMVDGKFRTALIHTPFERLYREVQTFRFNEPLKYSTLVSEDQINIQLPLELNHPIEEIVWVVRRKAVSLTNNWTNYSGVLEWNTDPVFNPTKGLLKYCVIQVNGEPVIEGSGDFFRQSIAECHRGGITAYSNYIYGYSFSRNPGKHNPSGTINTSRMTDIRLRLSIEPPNDVKPISNEWEVLVYAVALNWIRYEKGIANKLFSS